MLEDIVIYGNIKDVPSYTAITGSLCANGGIILHGPLIQADWAQTDESKYDFIKNKPDTDAMQLEIDGKADVSALSEVAFSGDYASLKNAPEIPSAANNGTLTIKQGGMVVGVFTANSAEDVTVDLAGIPTVEAVISIDVTTSKPVFTVSGLDGVKEAGMYRLLNRREIQGVTVTFSSLLMVDAIPDSGYFQTIWCLPVLYQFILGTSINIGTQYLYRQGTDSEWGGWTLEGTFVNDAKVTVKQGDVTKGSFSLNQSTDTEIDLGEPESMLVTITDNGSGGYTTDTNSSDIIKAFNAGRCVYAKYGVYFFCLTTIVPEAGDITIFSEIDPQGTIKTITIRHTTVSIKDTTLLLSSSVAKVATSGIFSDLNDVPTTLAGYGITDGATASDLASGLNGKADKATTLSGYGITDSYTKGEIDGKLTSALKWKGSDTCANIAALTDMAVGDTWNVTDSGTLSGETIAAGDNVVWSGTAWDKYSSGLADMSNYYTKEQADSLIGAKQDKLAGQSNDFGAISVASGAVSLADAPVQRGAGGNSAVTGYRSSNTATGESSFVGGTNNAVSGNYSAAFGYDTTTGNGFSFTAGQGLLNGNADGTNNTSHQVVFGKYNSPSGSFTRIVGNGSGDDSRSNCETLSSAGDLWEASDVMCGGADQFSPAHKLSLKANTSDVPSVEIGGSSILSGKSIQNALEYLLEQQGDVESALNSIINGQ